MKPAPRIAIDAYNLALEEGTGVATYGRNLSASLKALGAEVGVVYGRRLGKAGDPLLREIGFFDPFGRPGPKWLAPLRDAAQLLAARGGVAGTELGLSGRVIASDFQARLPAFDRLWNVDDLYGRAHTYFDGFRDRMPVRLPAPPQVMHWTYPLPIRVEGARNIYTLHDLVPLRLPHTTLDKKRRYLRLMRLLAREADHIVTVSECSRRDIVEILGVPEERVTNTYQTVDLSGVLKAKTEAQVREEVEGIYGLKHKGYFVFFGAIEPKKNVNRMLQAFLTANIDCPLVLVGKRAWKAEQELRLFNLQAVRAKEPGAKAGPEAPRLLHIDYVPFPMLMSLVRGARAALFPSLYEGFGLPVLEAMALGTPVITSDTSSLPEVAGDAALLVDPYSPSDLTQAIRRLDADAELRAELAEKGRRQAELFSPERYQARLSDLYARLGVRL